MEYKVVHIYIDNNPCKQNSKKQQLKTLKSGHLSLLLSVDYDFQSLPTTALA